MLVDFFPKNKKNHLLKNKRHLNFFKSNNKFLYTRSLDEEWWKAHWLKYSDWNNKGEYTSKSIFYHPISEKTITFATLHQKKKLEILDKLNWFILVVSPPLSHLINKWLADK